MMIIVTMSHARCLKFTIVYMYYIIYHIQIICVNI